MLGGPMAPLGGGMGWASRGIAPFTPWQPPAQQQQQPSWSGRPGMPAGGNAGSRPASSNAALAAPQQPPATMTLQSRAFNTVPASTVTATTPAQQSKHVRWNDQQSTAQSNTAAVADARSVAEQQATAQLRLVMQSGHPQAQHQQLSNRSSGSSQTPSTHSPAAPANVQIPIIAVAQATAAPALSAAPQMLNKPIHTSGGPPCSPRASQTATAAADNSSHPLAQHKAGSPGALGVVSMASAGAQNVASGAQASDAASDAAGSAGCHPLSPKSVERTSQHQAALEQDEIALQQIRSAALRIAAASRQLEAAEQQSAQLLAGLGLSDPAAAGTRRSGSQDPLAIRSTAVLSALQGPILRADV